MRFYEYLEDSRPTEAVIVRSPMGLGVKLLQIDERSFWLMVRWKPHLMFRAAWSDQPYGD